jgi:NitT/TauT family transport system ATP-binding protein
VSSVSVKAAIPHLRVISIGESGQRAVIEIDGITKTYQTSEGDVLSLRPVDIVIENGEFVVIVGPSGCGKTTLLKMIAGLLRPSSGEIRVDGRAVTRPYRDVGIVFQSPLLLPWRRVIDNVMMPVEVKGLSRVTYRRRALDLIKMVGLGGFERHYPWQLSGGMQQRVSICRSLVHDPKIVLMDEPFGALDAMTRERMNVELQRIQLETRKTVLLITHSIPEAVFLGDRVLVMTPRPGAIAAIYQIPLVRPRSLDVMADPTFVDLTHRIRRHFSDQHLE